MSRKIIKKSVNKQFLYFLFFQIENTTLKIVHNYFVRGKYYEVNN